MQKDQTDKTLRKKLFSADTSTVVSALNTLKEEGNTAYLPLLFDLLNTNPENEVEKEIIFILNNLKIKSAVPVLTEALQNPRFTGIRKKLATACWQCGLDFSEYLPVFVDVVIQEDWETGFEAFTVIDNLENKPGEEIANSLTEKISHALQNADDQKKYFLHEILSLIR